MKTTFRIFICTLLMLLTLIDPKIAKAQYRMQLSNFSIAYNVDYGANSNFIWLGSPITDAGWKVVVNYNTQFWGGPIYGVECYSACLAGTWAKTTVSAANGHAFEWETVSLSNPTSIGGLQFRFPGTDRSWPWWSAPPKPYAHGQTLELRVWIKGYSQPPDPYFGYNQAYALYFWWDIYIKAP